MVTTTKTKKRLPATKTLNGRRLKSAEEITDVLDGERYLTPAQVSAILKVPVGRLCIWRITKNPDLNFKKFGKSVRYPESVIREFVARS